MILRVLPVLLLLSTGCLALVSHDGRWHCNSNGDCTGNDICRELVGTSGLVCAAPNACNSSADCDSNDGLTWQCTDGTCTPPSCSSDAQCRAGYACSNARCNTSCTTSAQCASGYVCNGGSCAPKPCTQDADCDPGHGCYMGSCVACTGTPDDCSTQSRCAAPGCAMTSSCGGGYVDCQIFDADPGDCQAVSGCVFDTADNACTGGPNCADLDAAACKVASVACSFSTGCTGIPTPCSALSVAQCAATAGCTLQ